MDNGVFPFRESAAKITSHALAKGNIIYATNVRKINSNGDN